ncbi:hypothetical protein IGI71_000236 [Enterococcus sp. DIV1279b]|uniref:thioredoxin family protein n=1 Tax=Enterococcus TaxID=1350 RepID=UPI002091A5A3|nr:thioredoxin family protein [Enterococcus faecium]MCO5531879.1 thioredoxin family protein [Enterococcus faecium]
MKKKIDITFFTVVIALMIITIAFASKNSQNYLTESDKFIEEKIMDKQSIYVYFYYPECPACKKMAPALNQVIDDNDLNVYAINIKDASNNYDKIIESYGIQVTPTILEFNRGKIVARIEGQKSSSELKDFFTNKN